MPGPVRPRDQLRDFLTRTVSGVDPDDGTALPDVTEATNEQKRAAVARLPFEDQQKAFVVGEYGARGRYEAELAHIMAAAQADEETEA
jgi:hypothetical protein